jgi:NADH:ubiquinone oxidoreductase subunit K
MLFFLSISSILYFSGLLNCIIINNKNMLTFLISSEIMFLGLDLFFIGTGLLMNSFSGIIFGFILLMLTVGESVIGLGLCIVALKLENTINFIDFSNLKF